jgi:hypothetical protein
MKQTTEKKPAHPFIKFERMTQSELHVLSAGLDAVLFSDPILIRTQTVMAKALAEVLKTKYNLALQD